MKNGKKALSTVLALLLIITLVVPAGASADNRPPGFVDTLASEYEVTLNNMNPKVGDTLTANLTPADPEANYVWFLYNIKDADFRPIPDEFLSDEGRSYTIRPEDVGSEIDLIATPENLDVTWLESPTSKVSTSCNFGDNQSYHISSQELLPMEIGFDGAFSRFNQKITVTSSGNSVTTLTPDTDYQVEELDGTRISLAASYLASLSPDTYTLQAYFLGDVYGTATFTIIEDTQCYDVTLTPANPMVGDTLTATVEPADPDATYLWYAIDEQKNQSVIPDADSNEYTIPSKYVGYTIEVDVTASTHTSTVSSPATAPINAACTKGSGQGYNLQDVVKNSLLFSFNGDYDRCTLDGLTITFDGSETSVHPMYYSLAANADHTTELALSPLLLNQLSVGTYTLKLHYLGGSFGEVTFNVLSQEPITRVTLNNSEPQVGDVLSFVTEPENTDLQYRWTYKINGSDEEIDLGYESTYTVEEDDVGYLIGVTAWVTGSTTNYVESERTNPVEASVIEGNHSSYFPGDDGLQFRFNGAMNLLDPQTPVTVTSASGEEQPLEEKDYTIASGSTIVTLTPAYLSTLPSGKYILTVLYQGMSKSSAYFFVSTIKHTKSLVALGDSITTGYGLDGYQSSPVPYAKDSFVSILSALMGEAPTNLGVDGLTTEQLAAGLHITAMDSTRPEYQAIASGEIISLTIGGNDLLSKLFLEVGISLGFDPASATFKDDVRKAAGTAIATQDPNGMAAINAAILRISNDMGMMVSKFSSDLNNAIATIKTINPTAIIVLQTIPNPYIGIPGLSDVLDQGVSAFNTVMQTGSFTDTYCVIDVYSAFKESSEVLTNATNPNMFLDPHPNKAGHALIASLLAPFSPVEPGSVSVHVAWENDTNKIRPASIDVQLYKNGNPWGNPVTVSEATNWDAFWPEVNRDAVWTVDETSVPKNYTKTISADNLKFTITNTHEHVWDNGVITTPATLKKEGVKTFTCTICGVTRTEVIPKLPPVPTKPVKPTVPTKPAVPAKPSIPAKQSTSNTPKTGDNIPIMIFVLLTLGSLATITTITVFRRKRDKIE